MPFENWKYVELCTKFRTMDKQIFEVQKGFQSRKPKQKISEFKNFPKNISREPCKDDVCQESISSEKKKYVESCIKFGTF